VFSHRAGLILLLSWLTVSGVAEEVVAKAEAPADDEQSEKASTADDDLTFSPEVEAILNQASGPEGYGALERCIAVRSIRDSEVLDDQHVVFQVSGKNYYLVQFKHTCHRLRRGSSIAYEPRGSQLCRLDTVHAIDDLRYGGTGPPCSIPGFYEVTKEQVALLKETLKAEKQAEIDAYKAEKAKRKATSEP
jgi:hypothetical protein